jgi:hypothetical protein
VSPYLLVDIFPDIQALLVSKLYPANMKRINNCLDGFWFASGSSGERQDTKVRILGHKEPDHFGIRVISYTFVGFV